MRRAGDLDRAPWLNERSHDANDEKQDVALDGEGQRCLRDVLNAAMNGNADVRDDVLHYVRPARRVNDATLGSVGGKTEGRTTKSLHLSTSE